MKAIASLLLLLTGCINIGAVQTAPGSVAHVQQQTTQGVVEMPRFEPKKDKDELALLREVCKGRAWSYTPATDSTPSKAFCR